MAGRLGERTVTGNERRVERLCEDDVHGVVSGGVLPQFPRATDEIEMGMPMEIELSQIRNSLFGTARRHVTRPNEASETLDDLDIHEVGRMQFLFVPKEARLDACAQRSLQQELQQGGRVDDDHAESRSSRMTTAAGVFRVTRLRVWSLASISSRVGRAARRPISARR